jgi:AraC-like DNA-binding protein
MDVNNQVVIKTYERKDLSYFDLIQSLTCIEMTSTPLSGDALIEADVVDFGPLLINKRSNTCSSIEEIQFGRHTIGFQLPVADSGAVLDFLNLPGGDHNNPFQPEGGFAQWFISEQTPTYHVQVDARWLKKVLGSQAVKDYSELCKVSSRKAYDAEVLLVVAGAVQHAMDVAKESVKSQIPISASHLESLVTDILLPCIMSDLEDVKSSTRQKILSKALDYIRDNHTTPIRLSEVASFVATSCRNLQIVFKRELGVTPSRYIQQFRLHRFRHRLVCSNSVAEAAYSSGFKHLSRLTEQYAKVFDKYPSEDLQIKSDLKLDVGLHFE